MIAGGNVSSDWVDLACRRLGSDRLHQRRFDNTPLGRRQLKEWLRKDGHPVRITIEASGIYSLNVAFTLFEVEEVELMVAHPKAFKDYCGVRMRRAKTDHVDAQLLSDFCQRMPFEAWRPPPEEAFELRHLARRLQALIDERIREKGRLHAAKRSQRATWSMTSRSTSTISSGASSVSRSRRWRSLLNTRRSRAPSSI